MGSKLGWLIAVLLVLGIIGVIVFRIVYPSPSRPTPATRVRGFMDVKTPNVSPAVFLGQEPSAAGNAGDDYVKAVEVYKANAEGIDEAYRKRAQIMENQYVPPLPVLKALEEIDQNVAAGAVKKTMEYTLVHTPKQFSVKAGYPPVDDLDKLCNCLELLAIHHLAARQFDKAQNVLYNQFVLGWHMMNERSRAFMVLVGMEIQIEALGNLEDFVYKAWEPDKHAQKLRGIREYKASLKAAWNSYKEKWKVVWRNPPQAGDVYEVIRRDQDRAWRVEGVLILGVMRFTHANIKGDQRHISKLIAEYHKSPDPLVAAAAEAAASLDQAGFYQVGAP